MSHEPPNSIGVVRYPIHWERDHFNTSVKVGTMAFAVNGHFGSCVLESDVPLKAFGPNPRNVLRDYGKASWAIADFATSFNDLDEQTKNLKELPLTNLVSELEFRATQGWRED